MKLALIAAAGSSPCSYQLTLQVAARQASKHTAALPIGVTKTAPRTSRKTGKLTLQVAASRGAQPLGLLATSFMQPEVEAIVAGGPLLIRG